MRRIDITVDGVDLSVRFDVETYQREPFSWGASRGEETDVEIDAVFAGEIDITKLLSEGKLEEIKEIVNEECRTAI